MSREPKPESHVANLGPACMEAFLRADRDEAIGTDFDILPEGEFLGLSDELAFGDDDFMALFVGDGWQAGIHQDCGTARAYLTSAEDERCIGEFDGPSLVVAPEFRGRGIGKALAVTRLLYDGGENPQADCDRIGYTKAGLATMNAAFDEATALARACIAAPAFST